MQIRLVEDGSEVGEIELAVPPPTGYVLEMDSGASYLVLGGLINQRGESTVFVEIVSVDGHVPASEIAKAAAPDYLRRAPEMARLRLVNRDRIAQGFSNLVDDEG